MKFDRIALHKIRSASSQTEKREEEGAGSILRRILKSGTVAITEETVLREVKQFEAEAFRAVLSWMIPFFDELSEFFDASGYTLHSCLAACSYRSAWNPSVFPFHSRLCAKKGRGESGLWGCMSRAWQF